MLCAQSTYRALARVDAFLSSTCIPFLPHLGGKCLTVTFPDPPGILDVAIKGRFHLVDSEIPGWDERSPVRATCNALQEVSDENVPRGTIELAPMPAKLEVNTETS